MKTVAECLRWAETRLVNSTTSRLDAECLLSKSTGLSRVDFLTWPEKTIEGAVLEHFKNAVERCVLGEPVAYVVGEKAFWTLNLTVTPATLIPRPETETLVEFALTHLPFQPIHVLDLGTGSGAIAISLALSRPTWDVWASDISFPALDIAEQNAKQAYLSNLHFHQGSFFEGLPTHFFHAICSNPPYLSETDPHLTTSIRYEPRSALVSGPTGLECIEAIVAGAGNVLLPEGWLILEHGYDQAEATLKCFEDHFSETQQIRDLQGIIRVTAGRKKPQI